jgi:acetyl-CoA carboxylase beta subunit
MTKTNRKDIKSECIFCKKLIYIRDIKRPKKFCSESCRHKYQWKSRLDADFIEDLGLKEEK